MGCVENKLKVTVFLSDENTFLLSCGNLFLFVLKDKNGIDVSIRVSQ